MNAYEKVLLNYNKGYFYSTISQPCEQGHDALQMITTTTTMMKKGSFKNVNYSKT